MRSIGERMRESLAAAGAVAANRDLRRLQLAGAGSVLGNWAYLVALLVYAYDAGGPAAVGLVSVLRMIPAALSAPFISVLGDRLSRRGVMIAADVLRAALMLAAGAVIWVDGPPWGVYLIVTVSSIVATSFRPAQSALLPTLARGPEELTAANVAAAAITSIGAVAGPAIGAAVLAASNTEVVFALNALTFVWSALLIIGVREPEGTKPAATGNPFGRELVAGLAALAGDRGMRFLTILYVAQTLVAGTLNVLIVVTAFSLLDTGESGVGLINAAIGVGGIVGGAVALGLVGRQRLAGDFGLGLILFGAPLALIPVVPELAPVLVLFAVLGVGNTLVDVAASTLLQRTVPNDVLARAFGALQALLLGAIGVGALVAPLLVETIGNDASLIAVGVLLPVVALAAIPGLRSVDRRGREPTRGLELLGGEAIFAPLPPRTLEALAAALVPESVAAGAAVVTAGEHGDRFYLVDEGTLRVEPVEGKPSSLGPGDSFGEIALLRDVPRTATVTATQDCVLQALDREHFLAAVTGNLASLQAADAVIAVRLGGVDLAPGGRAV